MALQVHRQAANRFCQLNDNFYRRCPFKTSR
jgi:hypothetical protein